MIWPDYAILALILLSVLVGLFRGFIKEVFSLAVWAVAFIVAYRFSGDIAGLMAAQVPLPSARTAIGFTGLLVAVLLVGGLANYLLGKLVESTGLTGTDRLLGGVFGAVRGVFLVIVVVMVAGFTPIPADPWWQESPTIQRLTPLAEWAASYLPDSVEEHLDFEPEPEEDEKQDEKNEPEAEDAPEEAKD